MNEQRIIKFRGKVAGSWWCVSPLSENWAEFWVRADKKTIGQFVDWHDREGVEVYEGDIVRAELQGLTDDEEPYRTVTEEVRIERGFLAPFFMRVWYEEEWWYEHTRDGFSIIGNRFDQSELLK